MFTLEPVPGAQVDALADAITQEIPEPQQHAIDQAIKESSEDPEAPVAASGAVEIDALGIPWNSAEHATGADGKGIRTAKGTWRKRRGIKGSASHLNTSAADSTPKEDPSVTERRTLEQQNRMAGAAAATILIRLSTAIGGEEFQPRVVSLPGGINYSEETFLQSAFGDYFVAKGYTDIPPGAVLASAIIMYYSPRFKSPEVRGRFGRITSWFKEKGSKLYIWFKYRGKKKPESDAKPKEPRTARDYIRDAQTPPKPEPVDNAS